LGISRSTYYRRLAKAREQAAAALAATVREAVFDRLDWQLARLRRELETAARFADEGAAIIAELAAMASGAGCRWWAVRECLQRVESRHSLKLPE
jgi:4-alpha-glucanotransferase